MMSREQASELIRERIRLWRDGEGDRRTWQELANEVDLSVSMLFQFMRGDAHLGRGSIPGFMRLFPDVSADTWIALMGLSPASQEAPA